MNGITRSRLFHCHPKPAKLFKFEDNFFTLIEKVQVTTGLIDKDTDVRDVDGMLGPLWQRFTAHITNMGILMEMLKVMNR